MSTHHKHTTSASTARRLLALTAWTVFPLALLAGCGQDAASKETARTEAGGSPASVPHADEVALSPEAVDKYGIRVETADVRVLAQTLQAPARVSFNSEAMAHVGSPLSGRVSDLKVKLGSAVKRGDVLLVVESSELGEAQSELLQKRVAAQAAGPAAQLAKSALDRARGLYEKSQGIALTEVQKREAEYQAAEAAVKSADSAALAVENRLHLLGMDQASVDALVRTGEIDPHYSIRAPIDGDVIEREVTQGELVSPEKEALIVLADMKTLWVLADVPESRLAEVASGAKARVILGSTSDRVFEGSVAFVSPAVDASTRSAHVRIEVQDGHLLLRPGMFARAEIDTTSQLERREPVLAIPDEAVQLVEGTSAVFVPVPGKEATFSKRAITVGKPTGKWLPVLSGLKPGERFVAAGSFILKAELTKGAGEAD